jgi:hypothetical protein
MKNKILLITIIALGMFACKKLNKLTQFTMDYSETVTIPSSGPTSLPLNLFTPDVETNSESTFAINDTRKDLIEFIELTELTLDHKSPSSGDFSFLKSIEVFLTAEGLSEVKVAWLDAIAEEPGKTLTLNTSENNLMEYIKKDEFSLKVRTVTDETFLSDQEIEINTTFFVDAKLVK